jgi:hypothetical protein
MPQMPLVPLGLAVLPQESGYEEQRRTNRKYNYWQPVVWSNGMLWKTPKVFGGVLKQAGQAAMAAAGPAAEVSTAGTGPSAGAGANHWLARALLTSLEWGLLFLCLLAVVLAGRTYAYASRLLQLPAAVLQRRRLRRLEKRGSASAVSISTSADGRYGAATQVI